MKYFVSYKSEDANFVRSIVDELKYNGLDIWFVEYDFPIKGRAINNIQQFNLMIESEIAENGIDNADSMIIFSGKHWASSSNCRFEFARGFRSFGRFHGEGKIKEVIEIRMDDDYSLKENNTIPAHIIHHIIIYRNSREKLMIDLGKLLNLARTLPIHIDLEKVNWYKLFSSGYKFHLDKFKIGSLASQKILMKNLNSLGILGNILKIFSPRRFYLNGQFFEAEIEGLKTVLIVYYYPENNTILTGPAKNDRENYYSIYNQYQAHASQWLKKDKLVEHDLGSHLFFINGKRNFALTYYIPTDGSHAHGWERRYVIPIDNKYANITGELHFSFFMRMPNKNYEKSLKMFYGFTPYFDQIISTIKADY